MAKDKYDIIVIGAGSGGLSVGLFMGKAGFRVLMMAKTDQDIGGDCLNEGCVPSKALIHVSKIAHQAKVATAFGLQVSGKPDIRKAIAYVYARQEVIRKHENAHWLREQGIDVALGEAVFAGKNEVEVAGTVYSGKKIVIATGSRPRKLNIPGVEKVRYFDNDSIFHIDELPRRLLVIGGGPISIEMAQALSRLGSQVTVVHQGEMILEKEDRKTAQVLLDRLTQEGVEFLLQTRMESFTLPNEALIKQQNGETATLTFEAVFVGIGRELAIAPLQLEKAGIEVKDDKIVCNAYLQTTNKDVFLCGDIAGDLAFSHAAEFHARLLLNNFFSPLRKKLNNDHMSWVTFTDPELATFGLNEKQLKDRKIDYKKLEQDFGADDRAVVDDYAYARTTMYISEGGFLKKQKILGGTMVAPHAGELIQELILANTSKLSVNSIFNKIYPYPVASRINQLLIVNEKEKSLTDIVKNLLQQAYKLFS